MSFQQTVKSLPMKKFIMFYSFDLSNVRDQLKAEVANSVQIVNLTSANKQKYGRKQWNFWMAMTMTEGCSITGLKAIF